MNEDREYLTMIFAYCMIVALVIWAFHMGRESALCDAERFSQAPGRGVDRGRDRAADRPGREGGERVGLD